MVELINRFSEEESKGKLTESHAVNRLASSGDWQMNSIVKP